MNPEAMRERLAQFMCPYCDAGPFRSVATHCRWQHGLLAADIKAQAGIPRSHSLIAPETKELLSRRALERDSVSSLEDQAPRPRTVDVSEAGRASWRKSITRARAAQQRIPQADHDEIRQRLRDGELKRDLAFEYGVSVTRIRQIEQGLRCVMVRDT